MSDPPDWLERVKACKTCDGRGFMHRLTPMPGGRSISKIVPCPECSKPRMVVTQQHK